MAETEADIGFGTSLWMGNGAEPEVFTEVMVELIDINPPAISGGTTEATHHKSPSRHRERIATLRDTAEVPIQGHLVRNDAAIASLRAKVGAKAKTTYQIRIPETEVGAEDGEIHAFRALAINFEPATPLEDRMTWTLTLQPSGPVTVTAGPVAP